MAGWRGLTRSLRRLHVRRFALTARKRATTRVVASYVAATPRDRSRVSRTAGLRRDSSAQPATSTALDANPSARLLPRNARRPWNATRPDANGTAQTSPRWTAD